ncbi:MAG TPA: DNA repair protein RadA [Dermatophilaceae bacterium]|nr:DNA repair protein RadA [Dermatophilaceae bacterium]
MTSVSATRKAARPTYRCRECGWSTVKWLGRCGECQTWGSVDEVGAVAGPRTVATAPARPALRIGEVDVARAGVVPTGLSELDRVLGGGLVPGGVVLVAGEPGIGKSTLLLEVAARTARSGRPALYVTGEESAAQVRLRAERIEAMAADLYLAAETDLATVLGHVATLEPLVLVVDSVQTLASPHVEGSAGGVTQVREVAAAVIQVAKQRGMSVLLVGHVTKDGSIAGPRILEHLVDVVVAFEGDRHSRLRLARAVKNRFGPTDEVGCFDLSDRGIVGLADPSGLFLSQRDAVVPGTCVTVTLEGRRPLLAEVQALVAKAHGPAPRRTTHGVDASRVAMIVAALERRARAPIGASDAYVSTVGGVRIGEPAADLALALALASAIIDRAVGADVVAIGEVGLAGEIRPVSGALRRLAEAARLGFGTAYVPPGVLGSGALPQGLQVVEVPDLATAVARVLGVGPH